VVGKGTKTRARGERGRRAEGLGSAATPDRNEEIGHGAAGEPPPVPAPRPSPAGDDIHARMVCTPDTRIFPSRVTSGTPRETAVAAMIRSGMSGTSARAIWWMPWATRASTGATSTLGSSPSHAWRMRSAAPAPILCFSSR